MATIANLKLEILEEGGFAVAKVQYEMRPSAQDVLLKRRFREVAELIGDDSGPGEDGISEPIPNGTLFSAVTTFASATPVKRSPRIPLLSTALDEDPSGPVAANFKEDEIVAQVTLTPITVPTVRSRSNIVRRGGPVNAPPTVPA